PGHDTATAEIEVERDRCHVITEDVVLAPRPIACGDEPPRPSVIVLPRGEDGARVEDAGVEYLPLDGTDWTAPFPCDPHEGAFACGWGLGGPIEIWAVHPAHGGFYEVVEVEQGPCHVRTVTLEAPLRR